MNNPTGANIEDSATLILEQGTTNKSWTDQARDNVEHALGANASEQANDEEWEDLGPGHVATLDLKFVSGNDPATKGTAKQFGGVFDSNKSLLGMVEQLRFEPQDHPESEAIAESDEPMGMLESVAENAKELLSSMGIEGPSSSSTQQESSVNAEPTEGLVDKVGSDMQVATEKLEDVKEKGATVMKQAKEYGQATMTPAQDQHAGADKPVTERMKDTGMSGVQAVQDQFEKAKIAGSEAFRKTYEEIKSTTGEAPSAEEGNEVTLSGQVMQKAGTGIETVKDQAKKAEAQGESLLQSAKDTAAKVLSSTKGEEKKHIGEHTMQSPGKGHESTLCAGAMEKVDTGIHTVKKQVEKAKKQGASIAQGAKDTVAEAMPSSEGASSGKGDKSSPPNGAMEKTDTGIHTVKDQVEKVKQQGESLAESAKDKVDTGLYAVKEQAEKAKEKGESLVTAAKDKVAEAMPSKEGAEMEAPDDETLTNRVADKTKAGVETVKEKAKQMAAMSRDGPQSSSGNIEVDDTTLKTEKHDADAGDFASKVNLPIDDAAAQAKVNHEAPASPSTGSSAESTEEAVHESGSGESKPTSGEMATERSHSSDTDEANHPDTEAASHKKKKRKSRKKKHNKLKETSYEVPHLELSETPSTRIATEKSLSTGALDTPL